MIPFNKPHLSGNELLYIKEAVMSGKISGNGNFTKKCHTYFESKYGFRKALLTTSCTDALEMCAILSEIKPGDEVIIPSYTFVSTALAFIRQGASIVFADSRSDHPGIDENNLEKLITPRTKAIVPVHYAGVACDMDKIMSLASKYNLIVIEDAAQGIESFYKSRPLGSIGLLSAFSFHETKNINSGEGGLLAINDERYIKRAEIIWEKGTNRAEFYRGEVNKYGWVDIGSSFLPSEIIAAYLYAQLENIELIQNKRRQIWEIYRSGLKALEEKGLLRLPVLPDYSTNNGHMFYLISRSLKERKDLISYLKENGIHAVFHYISLHESSYYRDKHDGRILANSNLYSDRLVRLPLYFGLSTEEIEYIIDTITKFYHNLL